MVKTNRFREKTDAEVANQEKRPSRLKKRSRSSSVVNQKKRPSRLKKKSRSLSVVEPMEKTDWYIEKTDAEVAKERLDWMRSKTGAEGSAEIEDAGFVLTGLKTYKLKMKVFKGDPCTCAVTSNVAKKSRNDSATANTATVKQECLIHPEGWKEKDRSRRKAESARYMKNYLEIERQKKEETIRSENIRCCSTRLSGETL